MCCFFIEIKNPGAAAPGGGGGGGKKKTKSKKVVLSLSEFLGNDASQIVTVKKSATWADQMEAAEGQYIVLNSSSVHINIY